ncbi:MAG: hypothetical protein L6V91_05250 [Bacilli bacterium]|nr:MAG: hypothetical protein L6V91_05250 [Bacilli bacterium]
MIISIVILLVMFLGNIIIVDTIEMANIISSKINKKYKIVTLDGQVINVGGSLTGGSQTKSVSPISIKYEIEEETKKQTILTNKKIKNY